jgi:hypothetical protein
MASSRRTEQREQSGVGGKDSTTLQKSGQVESGQVEFCFRLNCDSRKVKSIKQGGISHPIHQLRKGKKGTLEVDY